MLSHDFARMLLVHRDNDIVAGDARSQITGIAYDSETDQIVVLMKDDELARDIQLDLITLLTELDRGLTRHDVGNTVWYLDWRKRASAALGLLDDELNTGKP